MSNTTSLLILFITAALNSRFMLLMMDDPEGPNMLVIFMLASIVWLVSMVLYRYVPVWGAVPMFSSDTSSQEVLRLFLTIVLQVIVLALLYVALT